MEKLNFFSCAAGSQLGNTGLIYHTNAGLQNFFRTKKAIVLMHTKVIGQNCLINTLRAGVRYIRTLKSA